MRLLLINPAQPETFWSFRWALDKVLRGKRALNPPLGLATLAALCPPHWEVTIVDENVEPLPLRPQADLIGIGGMGVQSPRQKQLLRYYREAGYRVVAGGSYASLCPEEYYELADAVIAGEAEYIWRRYCADLEAGTPRKLYRETGVVRLEDSPTPRFDLLKLERYGTATVQVSRGCPFRCEFCDIIVMFGRTPRYKPAAAIGRELDALRALGARKVFFVDDNFIGDKKKAKQMLRFLADYEERHGHRMRFGTEASLNLADDPELLALFRAAGFEWVFVGLETPDPAALREAAKTQNLAGDMLGAVRRIYGAGLDILAGFIIGFDRDTPKSFELQRRFIADSGIMVAMVGLLTALPKTPLYERLKREGRLIEAAQASDNTQARTNFVALGMTAGEMGAGYRRLYAELLSDRGIAERIRNKVAHFGPPTPLKRETFWEGARMLRRLLWHGILRGGPARAWHFARSLPLTRPRLASIAINDWIAGLALRSFAERSLFAPTAQAIAPVTLRITARLDRRRIRRVAREVSGVLARSRARVVLAIEALPPRAELDRLSRRLARHGDRVRIVLGRGIDDLLRWEALAPPGFLTLLK